MKNIDHNLTNYNYTLDFDDNKHTIRAKRKWQLKDYSRENTFLLKRKAFIKRETHYIKIQHYNSCFMWFL